MITLKNVTLRRGAKSLLDGASVTLNPGEKVGLVGRNGAGKSSLFALLDGLPGMLMIVPVFVPIAQQLGVDLLHYGIIMTTVMGIALFLPPLGVGLFIVLGIAGCTLREMTRHLLPYLATMFLIALVIAFVPWITYLLPSALGLYTAPGS